MELPSNTPQNSNGNQTITFKQNDNSVIDLSADPIINPIDAPNAIPSSLGQTIVSDAGGSTITAYFMNEDIYNTTPSDNGAGAGSVDNTYADGWAGNGYNRLATAVNQGRGIMVYGFTLAFITTAGGAQNPTGLTIAEPTFLVSNLVGNRQRPDGVPLNSGLRNTIYQTGTMTVKKNVFMSALSQFSYDVPTGNTSTLAMLTRPFN